jgi:hypothetical protein
MKRPATAGLLFFAMCAVPMRGPKSKRWIRYCAADRFCDLRDNWQGLHGMLSR